MQPSAEADADASAAGVLLCCSCAPSAQTLAPRRSRQRADRRTDRRARAQAGAQQKRQQLLGALFAAAAGAAERVCVCVRTQALGYTTLAGESAAPIAAASTGDSSGCSGARSRIFHHRRPLWRNAMEARRRPLSAPRAVRSLGQMFAAAAAAPAPQLLAGRRARTLPLIVGQQAASDWSGQVDWRAPYGARERPVGRPAGRRVLCGKKPH